MSVTNKRADIYLFRCRFLSTGDAQQTISHSYRLGKTTVFNIIYETCDAIWDVLGGELIKTPTQSDDWRDVAQEFENLWNFPHCKGALDGKHVVIESPANSGTEYYNYKGTFSIVLLAMCDAKYCFTMIDVGASGRESDGGVFAESKFGKLLDSDSLGIPFANNITNSDVNVPYVIVADAAFPLKTYMLKPYPGKQLCLMQDVFNYRLSRARRMIENTFGILCNRWRIFRRVISATPDNAVRIVKAACVLHNYLQQSDNKAAVQERQYCPAGYVDSYDSDGALLPGKWRDDSVGIVASSSQRLNGTSNKHGRAAAEVRNAFANYFMSSVGEIEWQYRRVTGTGPTKELIHETI